MCAISRYLINQISTSFALEDEYVNSVIKAVRDLLLENTEL
jgi:hypothetical protein